MKVLTKANDIEEMTTFLTDIQADSCMLTSWQASGGSRIIQKVCLTSVTGEEALTFQLIEDEKVKFVPAPVFYYCPLKKIIFKTTLEEVEGQDFKTSLPEEIKFLDEAEEQNLKDMFHTFHAEIQYVDGEGRANREDETIMVPGSGEANKYAETHLRGHVSGTDHIEDKEEDRNLSEQHISTKMSHRTSTDKIETKWAATSMSAHDQALFETELSFITLDEEDKMFEGKRAAPRAKPPEGKMVTVQIEDGSRPQSTHVLYDLSQGGIAFLVFSSDEYKAGETLHIKAFDTKNFETPMIAEIKSVREADAMGIQYKVGCAFA